MNIRSIILYSNQCAAVPVYNERPEFLHGYGNNAVCADTSVFEQLCPINPKTGFRDTDLSRLFNPATSQQEKEFILSTLTKIKGRSVPSELSDEDILSLIPSRYISDPVEVENFLQSVKEMAAQYIEPGEPGEPGEPVQPGQPGQPGDEPVTT